MTGQKPTTRFNAHQDRLSYLWLVLGMLFYVLTSPKWTVPLAAWLAPIFLLRFVRTQPLLRGFLLLFLVGAVVAEFDLQGVVPFPEVIYYPAVAILVLVSFLPYLLDRALTQRLGGLLGTLVFPLAATTISYLLALANPATGSFGNVAYTQYGNLPLMQLVSVTGLWGIDLLMTWLASLVNWAWERDFAWSLVRGGSALYVGLLALVLLFGGARLAFLPAHSDTIRIAGISPSPALAAAFDKQVFQTDTLMQTLSGKSTEADRQLIRQVSIPIYDELLAQSLQEAHAGAKVILWPEGAATVLQEDEAALLARASELAKTTGTYLDLGIVVLLSQPVNSSFALNESILIDPKGLVVWHYQKAHPVPGEPFKAGDGKVPTLQTPDGRLSTVICFDADFPATIRQAGQAGTDVLLVPSNDWREIDPYHSQMATFRAIENGFSLVRQTSHGLAITVDYEGNVIGSRDYFTSNPQVMVAYVPVQGVRTIYATIGDLFAWLSLAGLVVLIGVALTRRRTASEAEAEEPSGASLPVS